MITQEQVNTLYGRDVHDRDGDKIGSIGQIWADAGGQPSWASVRTGLFGLKESLIPLQDADVTGDRITVPYEKSHVKNAPNIDAAHDEPLTQDEVDQLYAHYNMSWDASHDAYQAGAAHTRDFDARGTATRDDFDAPGTVGRDTSGPTTDDAMTRSEERLNVSTERQQVGRARLRKYVVTEQQQVTVPVEREEVRLEREPITEHNRGDALAGPDITEAEHEVTLHAERPVVGTETVPVERVRLSKETVTEQETVGGEVRKEQIDTDLPGGDRRTV